MQDAGIAQISRLMLFREILIDYSENNKTHKFLSKMQNFTL